MAGSCRKSGGYRIGKSEDLTADKIRIAIADACRALRKKGVKHIETVLIGAGVNNISPGTPLR